MFDQIAPAQPQNYALGSTVASLPGLPGGTTFMSPLGYGGTIDPAAGGNVAGYGWYPQADSPEEQWLHALGYTGALNSPVSEGGGDVGGAGSAFAPGDGGQALSDWMNQTGYRVGQTTMGNGMLRTGMFLNGSPVDGMSHDVNMGDDGGFGLAALAAAGVITGGVSGAFGGAGDAGAGGFLGDGATPLGALSGGDGAMDYEALLNAAPTGAGNATNALGSTSMAGAPYAPYAGGDGLLPYNALSGSTMAAMPGADAGLLPYNALSSLPAAGGSSGALGGLSGTLGDINSFIGGNKNLIGLGGNLLSGFLGSNASQNAANAQLQASQQSNAMLQNMYNQTRADYAPYREAGVNALGKINNLLANPSSITQDPGYQFGMQQGQQGLDRSAAAHGGLYSGAQMKANDRFNQDYAGTKLNDAYNRYAGIAGIGQQATGGTSSAGQNYGNAIGQNILGMGNANASSYVGSANAWGGAIGGALNGFQQNQLMDLLMKKGP